VRELKVGDYFYVKYLGVAMPKICQVTQDAGRHIWYTDGDEADWFGPEDIVFVED
jgi:hypothetical protein